MDKFAENISYNHGISINERKMIYITGVNKIESFDEEEFFFVCTNIFDRFYNDMPIRKVSITAGGLIDDASIQLNLFSNVKTMEDNKKLNEAVDKIKEKYGNNSIIKASNLLPDSTAIDRNGKIGGHSA